MPLATRAKEEEEEEEDRSHFPVSGDQEADWSVGVVEATRARRGAVKDALVTAGAEHRELPETLHRGRPLRSHEGNPEPPPLIHPRVDARGDGC